MKIWIVSQGWYSDYRIIALFETEEEAKAFTNGTESQDGLYDVQIEDWETGIPEDGAFQLTHHVELRIGSGEELHRSSHFEQHPRDWSEGCIRRDYSSGAAVVNDQALGRSVISPEHALKIAVETRQRYLAKHVHAG